MWFVKQRKYLLWFSVIYSVIAIGCIARFGLPFGIDFTGGSLLEVSYTTAPEQTAVEAALAPLGLGEFSVRVTTDDAGSAGYIVRMRDLSEDERVTVEEAALSLGEGGTVTRYASIGPVIGEELKSKSYWAIGGVSLVIVLYVAFAFMGVSYPVGSWVYGAITVLALLHDVLVPTAAMALMGHFLGFEADVLFVMALLAILGYSVNDTIVVFDRVRENLSQFRTERKTKVVGVDGLQREEVSYTLTKPFADIVGSSISETLVRSINTSLTTFLALLSLYLLGGDSTKIFALILMVGVVAGTYSSICIANPLLVAIAEYNDRRQSKK